MEISASSPTDLLRWFHQDGSHDRDVLCVLLAPSTADQQKVSELVGEVYAADALLGRAISLLLLHPDAQKPLGFHKGMGRFAALQGESFPPGHGRLAVSAGLDVTPLRETPLFRDLSTEGESYRATIAAEAARTMAHFVPEFMEALRVTPPQLPAPCVMVRGFEQAAVVPLGADWTAEQLLSVLRQVRQAADALPDFQLEYRTIAALTPTHVARVEDHVRALDATRRQLDNALEALAQRYHATQGDRQHIAEFLAADVPDVLAFDTVVQALSFTAHPKFRKDGQLDKARRCVQRILDLRVLLADEDSIRHFVLQVGDRAQALVERRQQLLAALRKIPNVSVVPAPGTRGTTFERIMTALGRVNLSVDLAAKAAAAYQWVLQLSWHPPPG